MLGSFGNRKTLGEILILVKLYIFFREFEQVKESMHSAISMNKTEILDAVLSDFTEVDFC